MMMMNANIVGDYKRKMRKIFHSVIYSWRLHMIHSRGHL